MKHILIDNAFSLLRMALLEEGKPLILRCEMPHQQDLQGSLFLGRVVDVHKGMHSAFVDIGLEKNAFLSLTDVPDHAGGKAVHHSVRPGQEVLVSVIRQPGGDKGLRVSLNVSIGGHRLVYWPLFTQHAASRRLPPDERKRLTQLLGEINTLEGGFVVRTSAANCDALILGREMQYLSDLWQTILQNAKSKSAPQLIYCPHTAIQFLSDELCDGLCVTVNDSDIYQQMQNACKAWGVSAEISMANEADFAYQLGIDDAMQDALKRKVWLKDGGQIVFDKTEAMHVVDVNSGKHSFGRDGEQAIYKINTQAADEIMHQIRLRNLSGSIVVDFINMKSQEHQTQLTQRISQLAKQDHTPTQIYGFTSLGLFEISRMKRHAELAACIGDDHGRLLPLVQATLLLRRAQKYLEQGTRVRLEAPENLLDYIRQTYNNDKLALVSASICKIEPEIG